MIPIALNPGRGRLALAGAGALALERLRALRAAGAAQVAVFSDAPEAGLARAAGAHLRRRLPEADELAALHALWIVDLPPETAEPLARAAQSAGVLVNYMDRPEFCDFHAVAEIRRNNLLLTVSTGGAAPGLAGLIRQHLAACFGPEWAERTEEVARLRELWRRAGISPAERKRRIAALAAEQGWLPDLPLPGPALPGPALSCPAPEAR